MANVTISDDVYFTTEPASNISTSTITDGGGITVRVTPKLFEFIVTNVPIVIPVPVPAQRQPSTVNGVAPTEANVDDVNVVNIIDIFKINTIFNVQGVLADLKGTGEDTALAKSNNLKILSKYGGTIRMVYRGTDSSTQKVVEGLITKLSIKEDLTGRETDLNSISGANTISYKVQIGFTRGTNKAA